LRGLKRTIKTILQYSLVVFCKFTVLYVLRHKDTSAPVWSDHETVRHNKKTGAEVSGHFGTSFLVPNCPGAEVSWCRSVLLPPKQ